MTDKKPYTDTRLSYHKTGVMWSRFFSRYVEPELLVWHQDLAERVVLVSYCGSGWQIQMDNALPEDLYQGKTFIIRPFSYHRIIKTKRSAEDDLVLSIKEWIYIERL